MKLNQLVYRTALVTIFLAIFSLFIYMKFKFNPKYNLHNEKDYSGRKINSCLFSFDKK